MTFIPDGDSAAKLAYELRKARERQDAPQHAARGLTERQIREAAQLVRETTDRAPTRARVAEVLHTSEATLRRAMDDLGMGAWPPLAPD